MSILHKTHFNTAPILFAAWSGIGNVGILAIDYLRRMINGHLFAQIDMSNFSTPESIVVNNGVARFPETPQSVFYHHHNPDFVIFESNAHPGGNHDIEIMKAILELAVELNSPRIYTAAAIPLSLSHEDPVQVVYACNNQRLIGELEQYEIKPMHEGLISGQNGLLLGFAASRGIDAVCLLATIPAYAAALTYHKGAMAIVNVLEQITGLSIDTNELEHDIKSNEPVFSDIEEKLKTFFNTSAEPESNDSPLPTQDVGHKDVPRYVMDKIEQLFEAAQSNHSLAKELKLELDKWDLYQLYEDRFLDLFENGE